MPNRDFAEAKMGMGGRALAPPKPPKSGSKGSITDKPAYPGFGAPGKTQPRSRNAGVPKAKVYPNSDGL